MDLILASTSPYRKRLLERLQIPFSCAAPGTDETPLLDEAPKALARRLAEGKARAVAAIHPGAAVIGSDQVASIDGRCIGQPGTHDAAAAQLSASSGRVVDFLCRRGADNAGRRVSELHRGDLQRRVPLIDRARDQHLPDEGATLRLRRQFQMRGTWDSTI